MSRSGHLFCSKSLGDLIRSYPLAITKEVETWPQNQILATSEHNLAQTIVEKYSLHPPSLKREEAFIESEGETKVDVGRRFDYGFGGGQSHFIPGMQVTIAVPFEGDRDLFEFQPSSFTSSVPRAEVKSDTLHLTFVDVKLDAGQVKHEMDSVLNDIERHLGWIKSDCDAWNGRVEATALEAIQQRKAKLLEQSNALSALGLPIKRRPQAVSTVAVNIARKRPTFARPATNVQT